MRKVLWLPLSAGILLLLFLGVCHDDGQPSLLVEDGKGDFDASCLPRKGGSLVETVGDEPESSTGLEGQAPCEVRWLPVPRHGGCSRLDRREARKLDETKGACDEAAGEDSNLRGEAVPASEVSFPRDRAHSPITAATVLRLREIASLGPEMRDDVFAKVGDSHSVGVTFLGCFVNPKLDLGEHEHLRPTLEHFTSEQPDGEGSMERASIATVAGIGAWGMTRDEPSLLRREVDEVRPRFATVMLGTNDAGYRPVEPYVEDMVRIVDELIADGIIPLLSTVPPLADADQNEKVLRYNAMLRALAASRSVPLIDLYSALLALPDRGLRSDGVHLSVDWNRGGGMAACRMTDGGLEFGANVRNLLTLEQLDRARRAVLEGEVLDEDWRGPAGAGTSEDPIRVSELPFAGGRLVRGPGLGRAGDLPPPCEGASIASGLVHEVRLDEEATLRVMVHRRLGARVKVEIRSERGSCLAHGDKEAIAHLAPGGYHIVLRVAPGDDERAEYLFSISRTAEPS